MKTFRVPGGTERLVSVQLMGEVGGDKYTCHLTVPPCQDFLVSLRLTKEGLAAEMKDITKGIFNEPDILNPV